VNDFKSKKTLKFCLHKLNESNLIQFVCADVCMCILMCVCVDCMQHQQQQIVYHSSLPYIIKRLVLRVTLPNTANTLACLCLSVSPSLRLSLSFSFIYVCSPLVLSLSFPPKQSINWAAVICGQGRIVFVNSCAYARKSNNNKTNPPQGIRNNDADK